jgi:hypothetical protein
VGGLSTRPNAIAVDATHVYYATVGASGPTDGAVYAVPLGTVDGGAGTVLAAQQSNPTVMAVDAQNVYWTNNGTTVQPDAGAPNGTVMRCAVPACGGGPQLVASGLNHPRGIALDAENVYWTSYGTGQNDGAVMKCPKTGCGTSVTVLAQNLVYPDGLAVDGNYVYFGTHAGNVQRVALTGGTAPEMLTTVAVGYPLSVAVDDKFVFFSTYNPNGQGTIQKLLK